MLQLMWVDSRIAPLLTSAAQANLHEPDQGATLLQTDEAVLLPKLPQMKLQLPHMSACHMS